MISVLIDSQWAIPVNTALILLVAIVNLLRARIVNKKLHVISQHAADAKNKCGAVRRGEDKEFIQEVKGALPTDADYGERPKRFTDIPE